MNRNPKALADLAWRQAQAMAEAHGLEDWHEAAVAQTRLAEALRMLVNQPQAWQPPIDIPDASPST